MSVMYYKHWEPAARPKEDFPYQYDLKVVETVEPDAEVYDVDFHNNKKDNLKKLIKDTSMLYFPFYQLLDEDNYDEQKLKDFTMYFKVNIKNQVLNDKGKKVWEISAVQYVQASNFRSDYRFTLIKSIDHLKRVTEGEIKIMSFDTETTGLNPDTDKISGISFARDFHKGYYIPIYHNTIDDDTNLLGREGLDEFYKVMVKAELVCMFNSRFDMRMYEYAAKDNRYDMSKVNMFDVQISAYHADPACPEHSLKTLEKHFSGYHRPDLSDTLKIAGIKSFDTSLINPKLIVFYAAQDAISTLDMYSKTVKYHQEFGVAAQLDQLLLYRLMKMENNPIRIDIKYLETELNDIVNRLKELDDMIFKEIGDVNLNSPKQKVALFESFGLDTGVRTKTGAMSTGKDAVADLIEKLDKQGKKYPKWLGLLGERADLEKLNSSFFGSLLPQAKLNNGRIRLNYRHGNTSTGRLSSGSEREF